MDRLILHIVFVSASLGIFLVQFWIKLRNASDDSPVVLNMRKLLDICHRYVRCVI